MKNIAIVLIALIGLGISTTVSIADTDCAAGKTLAAKIVSENSLLETPRTGEPKISGGTYSLTNITGYKNGDTLFCTADVLFENPAVLTTPKFIARMREHIKYTVNLTEGNDLYVEVLQNHIWVMEESK